MKRIIITILLITATFVCCAQRDLDQRFAGYVLTEPGAYKDGANFGIGVEYRMNLFYFGASSFVFPNLNGYTYIDWKATILGLNQHFGNHRIYAGGIVGTIYRGGHPYATGGAEFGYDYTLSNNVFIGVGGNHLYRSDFEFWENNVANYWRTSGYVRLGIKF
jgi:hypothetical protein